MLKHNFVLQQVGCTWLAVPVGPGTEQLSIYVELNETSLELFRHIMDGADQDALVNFLCSEYEVTEPEAAEHVTAFLTSLKELNLLKE